MAKKPTPTTTAVVTTPSTVIADLVQQTVATPAPAVIAKPNARAHLRALFDTVGKQVAKEEVYGGYYNVTINTHLTDLKNPKYAGKLGTMSIVRMPDGTYKRVA